MTDNSPGSDAGAAGVPPGTLVAGKYRVERLLGEGAVGSVYLARHPRLDLMLAVKMLQSSVARDQQSVERFERGARNLSRVNHPHVCRLYDFGETDDGHLFLVLEYVEGDSLADLIDKEGPMQPQRACQIVLHICRALHAAHETGIVHRDLKPGNVMIGRSASGQEVAKVVDFDIAKQSEPDIPTEVTQVGYVIGTPEYMSPEQLTGEELDGRSDLYSAGTILYRCLTGKLPFDKPTTRAVMLARLTEDPLPADVRGTPYPLPPGLQQVLDRSLMRDRNARYANAAEMASDIAKFTDGGYETPNKPLMPTLGGEATIAVPATQVAQAVSAPPARPPSDAPVFGGAPRSTPRSAPSKGATPVGRYAAIGVAAIAVVAGGAWAVSQMGGSDVPSEQTAAIGPSVDPASQTLPVDTADPVVDATDDPVQDNGRTDDTAGSQSDGGPSGDTGSGPGGSSGDVTATNTASSSVLLARIAGWNEQLDELSMTVTADGPPSTTVSAARSIVGQAEQLFQQDQLSDEVRGKAACVMAKGYTTIGSDVDNLRSAGTWARRGLDLFQDNAECEVYADMAN